MRQRKLSSILWILFAPCLQKWGCIAPVTSNLTLFKYLTRDGLWSKWKGSSCIFFSFLLSYLCFLKKNDDRQLHSMSKWPWLWNKFTQIGAPWAQKVVDAINFSVPQIQFHFCFNSVHTKLRFILNLSGGNTIIVYSLYAILHKT